MNDIEDFYINFIETVVREGGIWTLDNDGELIVFEDDENNDCIPFFATESQAEKAATGGWQDYHAGIFKMNLFINDFIPDISKTDLKFGIIQNDETFLVLDPIMIRYDIEAAHKELKGELGHPKNQRRYNIDFASELMEIRMEYHSDTSKSFMLEKPDWIKRKDPLYKVFKEENDLIKDGQIVYAVYIVANNVLFEEGEDILPGYILYSMDPYYNGKPFELLEYSWQLSSYLGAGTAPEEFKQIIDIIEAETERSTGVSLPLSVTDGREVLFRDILFQRSHLPGGILHGHLFPLLADPEKFESATVLPKYYWSDNIVKVFIDDDIPSEIIERDKDNESQLREEILNKSNEEKYTYFIKRSVRNETLWTLMEDDFIVFQDRDGQRWLPLWPEEEFADSVIEKVPDLENAKPYEIDIYEFTVLYTLRFGRIGWKAAVMWNDRDFVEKDFDTVKEDLELDMQEDPYWQAFS